MKKVMMMLAMLAVSFAMQAQTKFHDVEMNEATGPVKSISTNVMGRDQKTTFDRDGKMQRENMTDAVYDAQGYLQSAKISMMGQESSIKFKWADGKVAGQTMTMMGRDVTIKYNYDDKGIVVSQSINFDGQDITSPYTDYKFDDRGNWISRKTTMMGQEMEQKRTIEYFE